MERKIKTNQIEVERTPVSTVKAIHGTVKNIQNKQNKQNKKNKKNTHQNPITIQISISQQEEETDPPAIEIIVKTIETATSIEETTTETIITEGINTITTTIMETDMTTIIKGKITISINKIKETTDKIKETTDKITQEIITPGTRKDRVGKTVTTNTALIDNPITTINSTTMTEDLTITITGNTIMIGHTTMIDKATSKEKIKMYLIGTRKMINQNPYIIWTRRK